MLEYTIVNKTVKRLNKCFDTEPAHFSKKEEVVQVS